MDYGETGRKLLFPSYRDILSLCNRDIGSIWESLHESVRKTIEVCWTTIHEEKTVNEALIEGSLRWKGLG